VQAYIKKEAFVGTSMRDGCDSGTTIQTLKRNRTQNIVCDEAEIAFYDAEDLDTKNVITNHAVSSDSSPPSSVSSSDSAVSAAFEMATSLVM